MEENRKITCIVTLHGVGFQTTPNNVVDNSGYADSLHLHLCCAKDMGTILCDDPGRERQRPGDNGVIYVQSCWRDGEGGSITHEEGLKRLGTWTENRKSIIIDDAPLVPATEPVSAKSVAHIALIYSDLELHRDGNDVGATFITAAMGLFSAASYVSLGGVGHLLEDAAKALFGGHNPPPQVGPPPVSSRPRPDLPKGHNAPLISVGSQPSLMNALANDVACYVCYNEQRERVRSFLREALTRLARREDVDKIILNTHSNGTVIAFDVLRHLPDEVTNKIKAFITAGSPLRKYVDLFDWGSQIQIIYQVEPWYNFWDEYDPVGDPLDPPQKWHLTDKIQQSQEKLFSRIDPNEEDPFYIGVYDIKVDNLKNSYGDVLPVHNYWDNTKDFVPQLAKIVCAIVNEEPVIACKEVA